jgi:HlyD family secretion protein
MYLRHLLKLLFIVSMSLCLYGCNSGETIQGYVEGDYSYLASAVSGNLVQLLVDRGFQVKAGQHLFTLDPQPESDKLVEAKSDLEDAQQNLANLQKGQRQTVIESLEAQRDQVTATLGLNKKTYERYASLYKTHAIDKESLDQAESNYDQSVKRIAELEANIAEAKLGARENLIYAQQAAVSSTQAVVRQAEWALAQKKVYAPTHGEIIDYLYELGEYVTTGSPVIILLSPEKIKIIFYVPQRLLSKLKIGDWVVAKCDGCATKFRARITFISPKAEYTPPVIYSRDSREKLVFRVEAYPLPSEATQLHPGQPLDVTVSF